MTVLRGYQTQLIANRVKLIIEDWPFNLWFHPESKDLSLYAEASSTKSTAPAYEIIKHISKRFDSELARGQYQSEFISYGRNR